MSTKQNVLRTLVTLYVLMVANGQSCPSSSGTTAVYDAGAKKCYALSTSSDDFNGAKSGCNSIMAGAKLAMFTNAAEADAVVRYQCAGAASNIAFWVGLRCNNCDRFSDDTDLDPIGVNADYFMDNIADFTHSSNCFTNKDDKCIYRVSDSNTSNRRRLCNSGCGNGDKKRYCCEATPLPSPSTTPSNTPSTSFSRTGTPSPPNTPSNTRTPTGTSTNTRTPSNTPSNTRTVTPSRTASRTQTPSRTSTPSNTRTRTGTGTNTRTPSNSPTASLTRSQSKTPSQTPSETPSNTPSPSVTATGTQTRTGTPTTTQTLSATPTVTSTATPSRTASVTPSTTTTLTATQTPSRTSTGSTSSTLTATPTNTPSGTVTPSNSPQPLQVTRLEQRIDTAAQQGVIVMIGNGYRPIDMSLFFVRAANFEISSVSITNETYMEVRCPIPALLWAHTNISVRVDDMRTTFIKPAAYSASWTELQPVEYGSTLSFSATDVGVMELKQVFLTSRDTAQPPSSCDLLTVEANGFTCRAVRVRGVHLGQNVSVEVLHAGNVAPIPLRVSVVIQRPTLSLGAADTAVRAYRNLKLPYRLSSWPYTGSAALSPATDAPHVRLNHAPVMSSLRDMQTLTWALDKGRDARDVSLRIDSKEMRMQVNSARKFSATTPTIAKVTPRDLQWMDGANYTLSVVGQGLRRLGGVMLGSSLYCAWDDTQLTDTEGQCTVTMATSAALSFQNDSFVDVLAAGLWQSSPLALGPSVAVHSSPRINVVFPPSTSTGARVVFIGTNFLAVPCATCTPVEPIASIGGLSCVKFRVYHATVASCEVPQAAAFDDRRRAAVHLQNNVNVTSTHHAYVTMSSSVTMNWYTPPPNISQVYLPSGDGAVFPVSPTLSLQVWGYGPCSCRIDFIPVQVQSRREIVSRLLFNSWSGMLGMDGQAFTLVHFPNLGLQLPSNSSVLLAAACTNDDSRSTLADTVPVSTIAWDITWLNSTVIPWGPQKLDPLLAEFRVYGHLPVEAASLTLFDCTARLMKANGQVLSTEVTSVDLVQFNGNDQVSVYRTKFDKLSAANAAQGGQLTVSASCSYRPSHEKLDAPAITISVYNASVSWLFDIPEANTAGILRTPWRVEHEMTLTLQSTAPPGQTFECKVVQREIDGAFLEVSDIRMAVVADQPYSFTVAVDGSSAGYVEASVECAFYEQRITSRTFTFVHQQLHLSPSVTLPTYAVLSDPRVPALLEPRPQFALENPYNLSAICQLSASDVTLRVRSPQTDPPTFSLVDTSDMLDLYVTATDQFWAAPSITTDVVVSCSLSNGDDVPEVRWSINILRYRVVLPSVATNLSTDNLGRLPQLGMTMALVPEAATVVSDAAAVYSHILSAELAQCRLATTDGSAYIQRGVATLSADGTATFGSAVLLGSRGSTYGLTGTCEIAGMRLQPSLSVTVSIQGCPRGTQPSALICESCPAGSYSLDMNAAPCTKCPRVGVTCSNGLLRLLPNYYRPERENGQLVGPDSEFHPCFNAVACVINQTSFRVTCSAGYTGPLCAACDVDNNYELFGAACGKCWPDAVGGFFLVLMLFVFIGIVAFIGLRKTDNKRSEPAVVVRISLAYIQALNSMQLMKAGGTQVFKDAMGWTQSVGASPTSMGPIQCVLRWSIPSKFVGTLLTPVAAPAVLIVLVAIITAIKARGREPYPHVITSKFKTLWKEWLKERRLIASFIMFLMFAYMPIVSSSLELLGCYDNPVGGVYYMRASTKIQCDSYEHNALRITAIFTLFLFGLGFPGWLLLRLSGAEDKVDDEDFRKAFGFLYDGYRLSATDTDVKSKKLRNRGNLVWWESVVLLRKAVIAALAVAVPNPFYQVVGAMLCFACFTAIQQYFRPYLNQVFNRLELLTLSVLFITAAISGVLLPTLDVQGNPATNLTPATAAATSFLIILNFIVSGILVACLLVYTCRKAKTTQVVQRFRRSSMHKSMKRLSLSQFKGSGLMTLGMGSKLPSKRDDMISESKVAGEGETQASPSQVESVSSPNPLARAVWRKRVTALTVQPREEESPQKAAEDGNIHFDNPLRSDAMLKRDEPSLKGVKKSLGALGTDAEDAKFAAAPAAKRAGAARSSMLDKISQARSIRRTPSTHQAKQ